jgi:hypothetical protein
MVPIHENRSSPTRVWFENLQEVLKTEPVAPRGGVKYQLWTERSVHFTRKMKCLSQAVPFVRWLCDHSFLDRMTLASRATAGSGIPKVQAKIECRMRRTHDRRKKRRLPTL